MECCYYFDRACKWSVMVVTGVYCRCASIRIVKCEKAMASETVDAAALYTSLVKWVRLVFDR